MSREYANCLQDIIEAIAKAESFVDGMALDDFKKDDKTLYAVIRALEVIGEAVKKVPSTVRHKHKNIPWKEMAGMRDKLIHEYFGVKPNVVWHTVKRDLPQVKPLLEAVLVKDEL